MPMHRSRATTTRRTHRKVAPSRSTGVLAHVRKHATKYGLGATAVTALAVADKYLKQGDGQGLWSAAKGFLASTSAGRKEIDKVEQQEGKVQSHAEDAAVKAVVGDNTGATVSANRAANAAAEADRLKLEAAEKARLAAVHADVDDALNDLVNSVDTPQLSQKKQKELRNMQAWLKPYIDVGKQPKNAQLTPDGLYIPVTGDSRARNKTYINAKQRNYERYYGIVANARQTGS